MVQLFTEDKGIVSQMVLLRPCLRIEKNGIGNWSVWRHTIPQRYKYLLFFGAWEDA